MYAQYDIIGCTMMINKSLFERMTSECKWFLDNNSFFDSVWAYWFAQHSKIFCIPETMSAYRIQKESGCHTSDSNKQLYYSKRYYLNKAYFIINCDLPIDEKLNILSKEYKYLHQNAYYEGVCSVRNSRSYKIGKRITSLFKCFNQSPK